VSASGSDRQHEAARALDLKIEQAKEVERVIAEAQTDEGCRQILEAVAQQVVAELDAKEAEFKRLPTLADLEKQRIN
jgi:cobalamin biosynthesis protein CbiD